MRLEANGHAVAYADTDSLLSFPTAPNVPTLNELCQISDRLGCLKIEKDGVSKFFCTAAKTYSLETVTGEISIKAKGFNLLEKLLKDNREECLLEKNIAKMFAGVSDFESMPDPSTLVFQKQIKVSNYQMVPALVTKDKSYKLLNFIGPRRQIDLNNWVGFEYQRVLCRELKKTTVDPLKSFKPNALESSDMLFSCSEKEKNTFETPNPVMENSDKEYRVLLVPKIKGLLPALPYGFSLNKIESVLPYYKLLKKDL